MQSILVYYDSARLIQNVMFSLHFLCFGVLFSFHCHLSLFLFHFIPTIFLIFNLSLFLFHFSFDF